MKESIESAEKTMKRAEGEARRFEELERLICAPETSADNRVFRRLEAEMAALEPLYGEYSALKAAVESGADAEIKEKDAALKTLLTRRGSFADETAVLEVCADNGGGQKFAQDLFSAYESFCQKNGIKFLKKQGGVKACYAAELSGIGAYGLLKGETGAHKGVCENGAQIKACVLVYPQKTFSFAPDDNDIKIELYHSGGAGGQNVNKVETAVRATYLPLGITAVCQDERSQLKNKEKALAALYKRTREYYNKQIAKENAEAKKTAEKLAAEGKTVHSLIY